MPGIKVSIIVPTLNEENAVTITLKRLREIKAHEVIVVDGGSQDRTKKLAEPLATDFLVETGGLAEQLNRGARQASGDVLLFHHADVRLPDSALEEIRKALGRPEVVGGAFRLRFESNRLIFRLIAGLANFRNRLGFGPFGDQAIFARRKVFEELEGFSPAAVLEDFDLVTRLKRAGRFVIIPSPVRSSIRRYQEGGILATSAAHYWSGILYLLGARRKVQARKAKFQRMRGKGRNVD